MSRSGLTATYVTSSANTVNVSYAVYADFASGSVRLWSGLNNITLADPFGSGSYQAIGQFGSISPVTETAELSANSMELTLTGVPSDNIVLALTDNYRGRAVCVFMLLHNDTFTAYEQVTIFRGRMNQMTISDGGDTSVIKITCEGRLVELQRPIESRYTHEEQSRRYPGDLGLQYVASIAAADVYWGQTAPKQATAITTANAATTVSNGR